MARAPCAGASKKASRWEAFLMVTIPADVAGEPRRGSGACRVQHLARLDRVARAVEGVEPEVVGVHLARLPGVKAWFVVLQVVAEDGHVQATGLEDPPHALGHELEALPASQAIDLE